jgi:hypothetical protein
VAEDLDEIKLRYGEIDSVTNKSFKTTIRLYTYCVGIDRAVFLGASFYQITVFAKLNNQLSMKQMKGKNN